MFWISVITLSLVDGFTSYSHTMLLRSRPFHQHKAFDLQMTLIFNVVCFVQDLYTDMPLWPSNGRETFICVEELGKNPHFSLVKISMKSWMLV